MHVENKRVRQRPHLQETPLGAPGLIEGRGCAGGDAGEEENACGGASPMAPEEFRGPIAGGVQPGEDGTPIEIAAEIVAERGGGAVSPLRFLPDRGHDDGVEIAAHAVR